VVEVDGKKRFKIDDNQREQRADLIIKDVKSIPFKDAQKQFRKITNISQYTTFYGSKANMT